MLGDRADPFATPLEILPEWYLYPVFQILRVVPNKLLGIALQTMIPLGLMLIPFIESFNKFQNPFRRPIAMAAFLFGTIFTIYLGIGAALPKEASVPPMPVNGNAIVSMPGAMRGARQSRPRPVVARIRNERPCRSRPRSVGRCCASGGLRAARPAPNQVQADCGYGGMLVGTGQGSASARLNDSQVGRRARQRDPCAIFLDCAAKARAQAAQAETKQSSGSRWCRLHKSSRDDEPASPERGKREHLDKRRV